MINKSAGLILAKSKSNRLPGKNTLPWNGRPMFLENTIKCLEIFNDVYVSSDDDEILALARNVGAKPIKRGEELCGDTPNIEVYRHALDFIDADYIVAVQANSPNVDIELILDIDRLMEYGFREVMTCHKDYSIYGSVWGLTRTRVKNYRDPYNPNPQVLIVDDSIDIHTEEDYNKSINV